MTLGVRTTSAELSDVLDAVLADYRSETAKEPSYSIAVGGRDREACEEGTSSRGPRRLHALYRGNTVVARARQLTTVVDLLLSELEIPLLSTTSDTLHLSAALLRCGDTTALVPPAVVSTLGNLGRSAERNGVHLPGSLTTAVDPESGLVVPTRHQLTVEPRLRQRLRELAEDEARQERIVVDGPSRVDAVVNLASGTEFLWPRSRATTLHELASATFNLPEVGGSRTLEGLQRLVEGASCYGMRFQSARPLLETMLTVLRPGVAA